jgi:DNA-binding PadR family transcriptional regulator
MPGTRQRTRTLTTTEAAVLALLAIEGEQSGYDLLKQVSRSIGQVWAPAKSQLYAVLPRLVRDGLATAQDVAQDDRPDKRVYTITKSGEAALDAWLATVEPGKPATFFLKAFLGGLMPRQTLIAHYEQFARDREERLGELRAIEPTNSRRGHDWFHYQLLRLGIENNERHLAWANDVLEQLRKRR